MANISIDDLSEEISSILDDYSEECRTSVDKAAQATAKSAAQKLRSVSPKSTGKYARGWTSKNMGGFQTSNYTIYNAKAPGLAHLLENGHVVVSHGKVLGTTAVKTHIKPVEEEAVKTFEEKIRKAMR